MFVEENIGSEAKKKQKTNIRKFENSFEYAARLQNSQVKRI